MLKRQYIFQNLSVPSMRYYPGPRVKAVYCFILKSKQPKAKINQTLYKGMLLNEIQKNDFQTKFEFDAKSLHSLHMMMIGVIGVIR